MRLRIPGVVDVQALFDFLQLLIIRLMLAVYFLFFKSWHPFFPFYGCWMSGIGSVRLIVE